MSSSRSSSWEKKIHVTSTLNSINVEIDTEFDAKDIDEMVRMADKNGDGEIDFNEFKSVMKQKKGKDATEKQRILRDMKEELVRYLK